MHYKNNNNEMNSNTTHTGATTATTANTSCSSSTDSGVIIIDNETTYSNHNGRTTTNATPDNRNEETSAQQSEKLNFNKNIHVINAGGAVDNRRSNSSTISIENTINIAATKRSSAGSAGDNGRRKEPTPSRHSSPTVSIRSTSISIVSIDENAIDSSVVDSDSDYEGHAEGVHSNYVVKKLGQQTTYEPDNPALPHIINKGMKVIGQNITPSNSTLAENILLGNGLCPPAVGPPRTPTTPQIGSIALTNSTDVTFGDKHFYEGPVTIQQFLIDSREKWKSGEEGADNPAYSAEPKGSTSDAAAKANNSPPAPTDEPYKFIFNRKAVLITAGIIILTILIGILIVTASSIFKSTIQKSKLLGDGDDSRKNIPINSTIDPDNNEPVWNGELLLITRDEWMARPPTSERTKLQLPLHRAIISHTATEPCETKVICDYRVQIAQVFHMDSLKWDDIGYNFLIGGDGLVYEGRGWDNQGAHTKGYNSDSVGISFIGTFTQTKPTEHQLKALELLLEKGVELNKLAKDYRLYGARQFGATESPGNELYHVIKKWPHWSPVV